MNVAEFTVVPLSISILDFLEESATTVSYTHLGKQLKKIGMLVVQDQVWNRVTINRAAHKSTRYYIDEMPICKDIPAVRRAGAFPLFQIYRVIGKRSILLC